jgi:hypothetical protein
MNLSFHPLAELAEPPELSQNASESISAHFLDQPSVFS